VTTLESRTGKLEEWKRIIDSTSDLISVHDSDFNIVVANKAFAEIARLPLPDVIGRKCYEVIHGANEPPPHCPHRQALLTNSPVTGELYERRLEKHLLVSVSPINNEKREVIGSLHIIKDVTEREREMAELQKHRDRLEELMSTRTIELIKAHEQLKREMEERRRAEEAVKNRDRILGEALRIAKLSSYEWDMTTGEVVGSDEGYNIVGLPIKSSVDFSQVVDLIHPDDRSALLSVIDRAITTPDTPTEIECRIIRQNDGQERYVHIKGEVSFDEEGTPCRITGMFQDITARKKTERALLAAQEELKKKEEHLLEAQRIGHIGSYEWDMAKDEIVGSDEAYRIFGLEPRTLRSADIVARIHPDEVGKLTDMELHTLKRPAGHLELGYWIVRPDGSKRFIFQIGEVSLDEKGLPIRMVGVFQDITVRKQAEEMLRMSEAALLESRNDLRRLAGRLILKEEEERHQMAIELEGDFARRLTAIAAETKELENESQQQLDRKTRSRIRALRKQIAEVASDLHQLSRLLHPATLEKAGLAKAAQMECHRFLKQGKIQVEFSADDLPDDIPGTIALSLFRIMQLALDGVVRHAQAKKVTVALSYEDNMLALSVKDDGIGFDATGAQAKRYGLATMSERARLINGDFLVESEPGKGTCIAVKVPLKHAEATVEQKVPKLSQRQIDVLRLLAEGRSAKEIAAALEISSKTVEFHKYRMMQNLSLKTAADLIRFAVKHNLVPS
jgi:PAS domain S-box-containing protein